MASFMQRIGLKPMQKSLQLEEIDAELRAQLWSVLQTMLWGHWTAPGTYRRTNAAAEVDMIVKQIWFSHFKLPIDDIPRFLPYRTGERSAHGVLRETILGGAWAEAYDLLEFIVIQMPSASATARLVSALNQVLERENAGYRFVGEQLVPVTAPEEIKAIETAIERGTGAVREHLSQALSKLADRNAPDYRNSIKESISAVEAACQAVAGMPNATLNDCLKAIKKHKQIHGAFEGALTKLYGYTSDAGGIRHALSDDDVTPTHADAKFMLVSCSAFTNYLWEIAAEQGIKIE